MKKILLLSLIVLFSGISIVYAAEIENAYIIENDRYITCILEETVVQDFIENIKGDSGCKVLQSNAVLSGNDIVGTAMTFQNNDGKTYTLCVNGDVTGDGKVTNTDILKSKRILIEQDIPSEAQTYALDVNNDSQATSTDMLKLKKYNIDIITTLLEPKGISIKNENIEIDLSSLTGNERIDAKVVPGILPQSISYTSNNKSIFEVSPNGSISAKANGTGEIEIRDSVNNLTKICKVEVHTTPKEIYFENDKINIKKGETYRLTPKIFPETANAKLGVTYKSSDSSKANVSQDGLVTMLGSGKVSITCETENGKTATVELGSGSGLDGVPGQVADYLLAKGVPLIGLCALMGNAEGESRFNPADVNDVPCGGLFQWNFHYHDLKKFASERGKEWTDVELQMDYLFYDLANGSNGSKDLIYKEIMNTSYGEDKLHYVTWYFARKYEQPWTKSQKPDWTENGPQLSKPRYNFALKWLNKLKENGFTVN